MTNVQSFQRINQNPPVTQSQKLTKPTNSYGLPPIKVNTYRPPTSTDTIETFDSVESATYGPPNDSHGTPLIKSTSSETESSVFAPFIASQPFTARPTISSIDQIRLGSSKIEQNSNLPTNPLSIGDIDEDKDYEEIGDESKSAHVPQNGNSMSDEDQLISRQVSDDLNATTTPGESHLVAPLGLLDTPNAHSRKTNESHNPEPKLVRNMWKPLPPNPFLKPLSVPVATTLAPNIHSTPGTPSASSTTFQMKNYSNESSAHYYQNIERQRKLEIILPNITSKKRPSPSRNPDYQSFETSDGWSQSNSQADFHDSEESQVIPAEAPSPTKTPLIENDNSHYLTKVLAKDIQESMKKHAKNISTIDLKKLQKNIDGWTEQEFSESPNRAITMSLLTQPKHIPFEYLTTKYLLPCQYHNGILNFVIK